MERDKGRRPNVRELERQGGGKTHLCGITHWLRRTPIDKHMIERNWLTQSSASSSKKSKNGAVMMNCMQM